MGDTEATGAAETTAAATITEGDAGAAQAAAPGDGGAKTYDEKYVKELRAEAADNRRKLQAAEAKLKEASDKDLSETERLTKAAKEADEKATAAELKSRTRLARAEVLAAAAKANIVDPDAAYKLISDQIEFDDEGEPKGVDKLIEQLAKDKPYLLKQDAQGGGGTANPQSNRGQDGKLAGTKNVPGWGQVFKR